MRSYAYASSVDVLAHLSIATFTATSKPTATQVHSHLLSAADELDAALTAGDYTVPVATGATAASNVLRSYNAIGAALYTAQSHPSGKNSNYADFLERRWNAILTGLESGEFTLSDAGKDTTLSLPRYSGDAGIATGASPYFTRAEVDI